VLTPESASLRREMEKPRPLREVMKVPLRMREDLMP
jgi:hypothetical protein